MKVAVVGAGVVGVLTAHYLNASGYQVMVFDKESGAAELTSKANGAQLSYSYTDAMGSPALLSKTPSILLGRDPAFRIRPSLSPNFINWGIRFLRNCSVERSNANTLALQELALKSSDLMEEFTTKFGNQFAYRKAGKLVLLPEFPDKNTLSLIEQKKALGCDLRLLDSKEVVELDPSLADWNIDIAAALYSPMDASGDPYIFSKLICDQLIDKGVQFNWNKSVTELVTLKDRVVGLRTEKDEYDCDAAVICTAEDHLDVLKKLGIHLPILPVAGYSVTLPRTSNCPDISVTALGAKTVFCRLGDQLRVAGFADINVSQQARTERIQTLMEAAQKIAPNVADYSAPNIHSWMGFRPVTPDSQAIYGKTEIEGLFLNLGHGTLGWTLAAATSNEVANGIV